jgi:hypothetical protein
MTEHQPGSCFCRECRLRARLAAPTLYGFLGQEPGEPATLRQVFAWCPWCATWHRHGDQDSQPGDVLHRYAHCSSSRSPYQETGYLIAVTNLPLRDLYGQMKRATSEQLQLLGEGRTTPAIERLRSQVLPVLRPEHHGGRW